MTFITVVFLRACVIPCSDRRYANFCQNVPLATATIRFHPPFDVAKSQDQAYAGPQIATQTIAQTLKYGGNDEKILDCCGRAGGLFLFSCEHVWTTTRTGIARPGAEDCRFLGEF